MSDRKADRGWIQERLEIGSAWTFYSDFAATADHPTTSQGLILQVLVTGVDFSASGGPHVTLAIRNDALRELASRLSPEKPLSVSDHDGTRGTE